MWRQFPENTRFWNENDWERYFVSQDTRFAAEMQTGEFQEEPSADVAGILEDDSDSCPDCPGQPPQGDDLTDISDEDYEAALEKELNKLPSWRAALEFSDVIYELVSPICQQPGEEPMQRISRHLCQESYLVADYIAGGHEIGYDEDVICGNIALCNRALTSLDRCIAHLSDLPPADGNGEKLMLRAHVVRSFIMRRIEDLRNQVWWQ